MRLNTHHIFYDDTLPNGGWVVEITDWMHKAVTILQRMKSTEENLVLANNFRLAVEYEIMRMHKDLDFSGGG